MTARTEGIEELALPDMERRTANAIRYGTVMAVDLANARVRVKSGEIETTWLPWSTGRASPAKRRWDPPAVGEQVIMLSPGGDMRQGVVLPGIFQDSAAAPSASADADTTVYSDGTMIEYDRAAGALSVTFSGGGQLRMIATEAKFTFGGCTAVITSAGIDVTGGDVTADGISLKTHVHTGVIPGGANTGGPA